MATPATVESWYQQLLNENKLKRPANLAEVKIWLRNPDAKMPDKLVEQFQNLLDCECSKPDFFDKAAPASGFLVAAEDNFLAEIADVQLWSTKNWVQVVFRDAGPTPR